MNNLASLSSQDTSSPTFLCPQNGKIKITLKTMLLTRQQEFMLVDNMNGAHNVGG